MTNDHHRKFIREILNKYKIEVSIPRTSSARYVQAISECLGETDVGHKLLGMSMTAALIDNCRLRKNYHQLIELSTVIERLLSFSVSDYDLQVTALELRAALFWGYLRSGHSDIRLLEASSRILIASIGGDYAVALRAEAVLSQGQK